MPREAIRAVGDEAEAASSPPPSAPQIDRRPLREAVEAPSRVRARAALPRHRPPADAATAQRARGGRHAARARGARRRRGARRSSETRPTPPGWLSCSATPNRRVTPGRREATSSRREQRASGASTGAMTALAPPGRGRGVQRPLGRPLNRRRRPSPPRPPPPAMRSPAFRRSRRAACVASTVLGRASGARRSSVPDAPHVGQHRRSPRGGPAWTSLPPDLAAVAAS